MIIFLVRSSFLHSVLGSQLQETFSFNDFVGKHARVHYVVTNFLRVDMSDAALIDNWLFEQQLLRTHLLEKKRKGASYSFQISN